MEIEEPDLRFRGDLDKLLAKPIRYRKWARAKVADLSSTTQLNITVLGGYTVDSFCEWLYIFGIKKHRKVNVSQGSWGPAFSKIRAHSFNLDGPSLVVCLNTGADLEHILNTSLEADDVLDMYRKMVVEAREAGADVCCTYFDHQMPLSSTAVRDRLKRKLVANLNEGLAALSTEYSNFLVLDFDRLHSIVDTKAFSLRDWYSYGKYLNDRQSLCLAHDVSNLIALKDGLSKKVLVVDLDNTLWGGIVGDDGPDAIVFGEDSAAGRVYQALQYYIKSLKELGVLLCIASKNEESIAKLAFTKRSLVLEWDDFAVRQINWERKSENIKKIAEVLNVGPDSFVFLDDNPAERLDVKSSYRDIEVPEPADLPMGFLEYLQIADPFVTNRTPTLEDELRAESILANEKRASLSLEAESHSEYLGNLKPVIRVFTPNETHIERLTQLTNKTNQFNLSTVRLSQHQIRQYLESSDRCVFAAQISDCFGDYGLTSIMYCSLQHEGVVQVDNWLMSCRVFGKTAEIAMADVVTKFLALKNCKLVKCTYRRTTKNAVVSNLLEDLGFSKAATNQKSSESSDYEISLTGGGINVKHYCEVVNELNS